MKRHRILIGVLALGLLLALSVGLGLARETESPVKVGLKNGPPLVGTAFTYQGRLVKDGNPISDTCDFQFSLWDEEGGGIQIGETQTITDASVTGGFFTIHGLDFGGGVFQGDVRWLEVAVKCKGDTEYTALTPLQPLTPAPYALALPGLWTQQNDTSPNLIGGYSGNSVTSGVVGATIGGGGDSSYPNRVTDNYGTVGGGGNNQAGDNAGTASDRPYATVGGGEGNEASGSHATIGGGYGNIADGNIATVGGGEDNSASGQYGATVSGGENNSASAQYFPTIGGGYDNIVSGNSATIGGGWTNEASGIGATVGGGAYNTASGDYATVGGGGRSDPSNPATANRVTDDYGTVGGGGNNQAGNANVDTTDATYATVGGGRYNTASGGDATIGGGYYNEASDWGATVSGGAYNAASGYDATVGGGYNNTASGDYATVGGGEGNKAITGTHTTVGGGYNNTASGWWDTVGGGIDNTASGYGATVGGGRQNTASGPRATVPGGYDNNAQGGYSFAAGYMTRALHDGAFVWADSYRWPFPYYVDSERAYQFLVRAWGGARFDVNSGYWVNIYASYGRLINTSTGAYLTTGGAWTNASDRNRKENFGPVDGQKVLDRLAEVPITTWNYKAEDPSIRHMGPVAQDFYAAFDLGDNDTSISTVDADGVALAAVQGLYEVTQEQAARIEGLEAENATLQGRLDDLETRMAALEATSANSTAPAQPLQSGLLPGVGVLLAGLGVALSLSKGGGR